MMSMFPGEANPTMNLSTKLKMEDSLLKGVKEPADRFTCHAPMVEMEAITSVPHLPRKKILLMRIRVSAFVAMLRLILRRSSSGTCLLNTGTASRSS